MDFKTEKRPIAACLVGIAVGAMYAPGAAELRADESAGKVVAERFVLPTDARQFKAEDVTADGKLRAVAAPSADGVLRPTAPGRQAPPPATITEGYYLGQILNAEDGDRLPPISAFVRVRVTSIADGDAAIDAAVEPEAVVACRRAAGIRLLRPAGVGTARMAQFPGLVAAASDPTRILQEYQEASKQVDSNGRLLGVRPVLSLIRHSDRIEAKLSIEAAR